MQTKTGISRSDVLRAYEAAARHAGVEAAVDVLLDWAEAAQLQRILESLADTAGAAIAAKLPSSTTVRPLQAVRADRQPPA